MKQYLDLLKTILSDGYATDDRTGIGTIALPGYFYQCTPKEDENGIIHDFPLHTTKKLFLRGIVEELIWKLKGETNIKSLVEKDIHIWTEWPFKKWLKETGQWETFPIFIDKNQSDYTQEWKDRKKDFEQKIIKDSDFAEQWGDLGPTYGRHFRNFGEVKYKDLNKEMQQSLYSAFNNISPDDVFVEGVDQLVQAINTINKDPKNRRIIISLWDPQTTSKTLLPPCPCFYQFFANQEGYLHLNVYQRSCDSFLGVPFNDAQDCLLLILVAMVTGRKVGKFNHFFGDVHIYKNHIEQVKKQLSREPRPLPSLKVIKRPSSIQELLEFKFEDLLLLDYDPHPGIKAPVAI